MLSCSQKAKVAFSGIDRQSLFIKRPIHTTGARPTRQSPVDLKSKEKKNTLYLWRCQERNERLLKKWLGNT
jgi:hypothetical protein